MKRSGDNTGGGKDSSFVVYLPQDDEVASGLREREGGVDVYETQEVTDLLNEQLGALLCLPPRQFWGKVASDESLTIFLDSYLHFRRRWFDNPVGTNGGSKVGVVVGDGDLSRRVFMVLFRISSNHDQGSKASESLSAKEHAVILEERKLFDIPRLLDISAVYGNENHELARRLINNVFKSQPYFVGELSAYVPPLVERIMTMFQRWSTTVQEFQHPQDSRTTVGGLNRVQELLEVVGFVNDVVITLKSFVMAYPPAANILLSSGDAISDQGLLLPALVTLNDKLLPILQEGFTVLTGSSGGQPHDMIERSSQLSPDGLHKLGERLVDLSWQLIRYAFLEGPSEERENGAVSTSLSYEDALWKGGFLVNAVVALAIGSSREEKDLAGKFSSDVSKLTCTGGMLESMEKCYGLSSHILQAWEIGVVVLDDAQYDYLTALIGGNKLASRGRDDPLISCTESFPKLSGPEKEVEEEFVFQQSKISQVKDLFPEYGDGFIAACLEVYDNDPEKVIERIVEKTLHRDLLSLGASLPRKPDRTMGIVKDKGKSKINEQALILNEGKSRSGGKISVMKESGSSSSVADSSGATVEYSVEGILVESPIDVQVKVGRYLQHRKGDGSFSQILDNRHGDEVLRKAIKTAFSQVEYEDEYDDSFDQLEGYAADAGGNEETESLADLVGNRSRAKYQNSDTRNGRPVSLAPWGQSTGRGSTNLSGHPRTSVVSQKLSTVVPVVEPQADATFDMTAGQGRAGKGRRKWKEQGPAPQFYLKEGKLFNYKVAGAVGVSSVEEAESIKEEQSQTIHGLGAGGNVPVQQDANQNVRRMDGNPNNSRREQTGFEDGRGRWGTGHGRGGPGRGAHGKKESDNHQRKDQAMKKHFRGLGGL